MSNKKLNTEKAGAARKKGFFKWWTDRPTAKDLEELVEYYDSMTAELPQEWALEKLDSEERCHYLMLLKIADFRKMGKLYSIMTAFKMGYLFAQGKIALGLPDYEAGKAGQQNDGE